MSLLENIGYALDTPGALLRGALRGKPGTRATGRELLGLGENKPGLDADDVIGFLADVLVDPLNVVPFGALMKGGGKLAKVARAAGPRYATKLSDMEKVLVPEAFEKLSKGSIRNAERAGALEYVPPGSKQLGKGVEAVALETPRGRAIRIEPGRDYHPLQGRPTVDPVLQPNQARLVSGLDDSVVRSAEGVVDYGARSRFEHLKSNLPDPAAHNATTPLQGSGMSDLGDVGSENLMQHLLGVSPGSFPPPPPSAARGFAQDAPFMVESLPKALPAKDFNDVLLERFRKLREGEMPPLREQGMMNQFADAVQSKGGISGGARQARADFMRSHTPQEFLQEYPSFANEIADLSLANPLRKKIYGNVQKRLGEAGGRWEDMHSGNYGIRGGHPTVIDPGFIGGLDRRALTPHVPRGGKVESLSKLLGYRRMVRNEWEDIAARDPTLLNAVLGTLGMYSAPKTALNQ